MDTLSQTFQALADPTRRALLARLATGAATVGELAEPFDMSLPAVSRHLKVLTDAGLIERHTEAQWRRCELRGEGFRAGGGREPLAMTRPCRRSRRMEARDLGFAHGRG